MKEISKIQTSVFFILHPDTFQVEEFSEIFNQLTELGAHRALLITFDCPSRPLNANLLNQKLVNLVSENSLDPVFTRPLPSPRNRLQFKGTSRVPS